MAAVARMWRLLTATDPLSMETDAGQKLAMMSHEVADSVEQVPVRV
jgi:hypothetical protein